MLLSVRSRLKWMKNFAKKLFFFHGFTAEQQLTTDPVKSSKSITGTEIYTFSTEKNQQRLYLSHLILILSNLVRTYVRVLFPDFPGRAGFFEHFSPT